MNIRIGITAWGSVSALGLTRDAVEKAYMDQRTYLRQSDETGDWMAGLPFTPLPQGELARRSRLLEQIDRSVLLTFLAADQFWPYLAWDTQEPIAINIGSSRGATGLWEHYFRQFTQEPQELLSALSSPTTTLGNISSWLGAYLGIDGPSISHSVTCSSALQALINGVAWLESGRCRHFLAGAGEAPLTPFTIAQMKAMRIYAPAAPAVYPCRSLEEEPSGNTMVLGEGAALFALEVDARQAAAYISGIGSAQEIPTTPTAISEEGAALKRAMRQALHEFGRDRVDVVVCHAPGTKKGDAAELHAIRAVFGDQPPVVTGNKWKLGHTLGASGALSMEMALLMLQHQRVFPIPFRSSAIQLTSGIESVMVNALGFGGNAVSIILTREANL